MRKLFLFPAVLLGFLAVFQSCSKQSPADAVAPISTNVINATIAPNGSYQLPIENSGNVTISMQASHFQVSQANLDSKSGFVVYKYVPVIDYTGNDEVVLSNTKTSIITGSGCPNNHTSNSESTATSTSYITVKINIAN
ncbi:MAG: hypothetical protein ABI863_22330 [Ginsengibacter sp.]